MNKNQNRARLWLTAFLLCAGLTGIRAAKPSAAPSPAATGPLKIGLIGDSTVAEYKSSTVKRGWGQLLPEFLKPDVEVINKAVSGMSSKTFPKQTWQDLLTAHPDIVLIQFGHADSHAKTQPEATEAKSDFKENLRNYVKEAREAEITPILVTPMHRRSFKADGHLSNELARFAVAMKEVGAEMKVPVIDLYAASGALYESLGEAGSTAFTLNNQEREGRGKAEDRTESTEVGAREMAKLVVAGFSQADPRLAQAVNPNVKTEPVAEAAVKAGPSAPMKSGAADEN